MKARLVVACLAGVLVGCRAPSRAEGPPLPFDEEGACPFVCCTYREWTVDWDTDVYTDRTPGASVSTHVSLGQTVQALTGVVSTTRVGRAVADRMVTVGTRHLPVASGAPIYLIRNVGGGDWKIWVDGQVDQQYIPNQGYCTGARQSSDECAIRVVEQPENVWWVRVRDARGTEGWTREVDHFGNIDSCG